MRLNEISDEQKSFLTLKGIKFDFIDDYNLIVSSYKIIGKSLHRRNMLRNTINNILSLIKIFLDQGYDNTDFDVITARDIYNKLLDIKNQL